MTESVVLQKHNKPLSLIWNGQPVQFPERCFIYPENHVRWKNKNVMHKRVTALGTDNGIFSGRIVGKAKTGWLDTKIFLVENDEGSLKFAKGIGIIE